MGLFLLGLVLSSSLVSSELRANYKHKLATSLAKVSHKTLNEKRMEEESPIPLLIIAAEVLVTVVGGFISEELKRTGAVACVQTSPSIVTSGQFVSAAQLRKCRQVPVTFLNNAHVEKHYGVHSHFLRWLIPTKCEFQFAWQFVPTSTFYDCTQAMDLEANQRYIYLDAQVAITNCNLKDHQGYVRVFPSMPASVMATNHEGKLVPKLDAEEKMKFHINVEGWTGGACSGDKSPGVRWMFTYLVDLPNFTISYVTKMEETSEGGARPTMNEKTYVLTIPETDTNGSVWPEWTPLVDYQEKTLGFSQMFGIKATSSE